MSKICEQCKIEKNITNFRDISKNGKTYFSKKCKKCISDNAKEYKHQWYINNLDKLKPKRRQRYLNNIDQEKKYNKKYYENNKKEILKKQIKYNADHPEVHKRAGRKYHLNNKEKEKQYLIKNKTKISAKKYIYTKNRLLNDVSFRIRTSISRSIRLALKNNNSSKQRGSYLFFINYSIVELKEHLEKQFEYWMTWDNWGIYNSKTWDDNDQSTWTWQIDHIIPQSDLLYISMEDDNFKKCWSLSNLRPYSAKQNILDGANKTRHSKKAA